MFPETHRRRPLGRVVRIESPDRALAVVGGRTLTVTALRGGPLSCGDRVEVVGGGPSGPVVEVRNGVAHMPLLAPVPRMALRPGA